MVALTPTNDRETLAAQVAIYNARQEQDARDALAGLTVREAAIADVAYRAGRESLLQALKRLVGEASEMVRADALRQLGQGITPDFTRAYDGRDQAGIEPDRHVVRIIGHAERLAQRMTERLVDPAASPFREPQGSDA